jgi:hypothetical protein
MTQAVSRWPLISEIQAPIPVVARSKAYVCGRSLAEIAGSNPADSMDICVVCCRGTSDMRTRCKGIQWIRTERKKKIPDQSQCGIYGGHSGTWTGFLFRVLQFFPLIFIPPFHHCSSVIQLIGYRSYIYMCICIYIYTYIYIYNSSN